MAKEIKKQVGDLTIYSDDTFKLKNVVAAYPTLIKPKVILDNPVPKYSLSVLLDKVKQADEIAALRDFIKKAAETKKMGKIPSDKICLRDGDDLGTEAYEPYWRLSLGANEAFAPALRIKGEKMSRVDDAEELEEVCRSGAIIQVLGSLYLQDNTYGKRVNGNLVAVNFLDKSIEIALGGANGDDDDVWEDDEDL